MGRTLPWLIETAKAVKKPTERGEPRKSFRIARNERSPSTSPPPTPPEQTRMQYGDDETWIMVEDELLATAKTFTRHLHVAEYRRLQNLATRRKLTKNSNIERPTDGKTKMSIEQLLKKSARVKLANKENGVDELGGRANEKIKFASDFEESDDDVPIGDKSLAGLMHRGARARNPERRILTNIMGPLQMDTRMTAGNAQPSTRYDNARHQPRSDLQFSVPVEDESVSDEDDLDALSRPRTIQVKKESFPTVKSEPLRRPKLEDTPSPSFSGLEILPLNDRSNNHHTTFTEEQEKESDDDLDIYVKPRFKVFGIAAPRTIGKKPEENAERTSLKLEEIPTFLY